MSKGITLSLIIYYSDRGLLDNREPFKRLYDIINLNNPPEEGLEKLKPCIEIDEEDGVKGIRPKINNQIIKSPYTKKIEKEIAFTTQFNEMVEIIQFGLTNNAPIILEGMNQGKQLCINYISELLGYEVVNWMIFQSKKEEDFLGKIKT